MNKRKQRLRSAVFNELYNAKAAGETMRGYNATARAVRKIRARGHAHGRIDDSGLRQLDEEGSLLIVIGSKTALLDAEVTITDEAFGRRGGQPQ